MAESLSIEIVKTTKAKNTGTYKVLYTLKRVSAAGKQYWVCESVDYVGVPQPFSLRGPFINQEFFRGAPMVID